jgi:surfeit locus 1 family protein
VTEVDKGLSRRAMLAAALCAVAGVAVLLSLARWQASRAVWKEGLIADLTVRLAAPPIDLPVAKSWNDLSADKFEFVRVRFRAEIPAGQEALVYTTGSSLRPDVKGPGYWVFAPARLPSGGLVVVNRGFLPQGGQDMKGAGLPGVFDIVGALRWPEARNVFTPNDDPAHNLWFARDQLAMAKEKGWGTVAPFYVEQEQPPAPNRLPQAGTLVPNLPNNHRQYELTWIGLAIVLMAVFGTYFWRWYSAQSVGGGQ